MSWSNTANKDTNQKMCMDVHPLGKHLHSPFIKEAHCNYQKNEQIKEEPVIFPYNIGYGYRRTAGWLMNNNELNLPVDNEMYAGEEIVATERNAKESIDDPRRGAKTLRNDWICSENVSINVSIIPQCSGVTNDEEDFKDAHTHHDLDKFIDTEKILSYAEEYKTQGNSGICTNDKSERNMIHRNEDRT